MNPQFLVSILFATILSALCRADSVIESDSLLTQFLANNLVQSENGKIVPYDFYSKDEPEYYAFYYSAHWCGPCRKFTPELRDFYNSMKASGYDNFEIVFVSRDRGRGAMVKYMKQDSMPWPAVQYDSREDPIVSTHEGRGIPCLVITDKYGKLISHSYRNGRYVGPSTVKDDLTNLLMQ